MNVVVLKYHDNFADNLSELAYAKILEKHTNGYCYFENDSLKRQNFERKMSNFCMDYRYISKNQVLSVVEKSYLFSRNIITTKKISKEIFKVMAADKILDVPKFKIDDIRLVDEDIRHAFEFKNNNFIINFDILDDIINSNSIGVYINKKDTDAIDTKYLFNAVERLNKYLKKPKLFIFTKSPRLAFEEDLEIPYQKVNIIDWREEFHLLRQCRNKIILSNDNSYSSALWSSVLNENTYLVAYDKKHKTKMAPENWIGI